MARSALTGERFSRAYPGESVDKSAARLFLYKIAKSAPRVGHAITLAGPEPWAEMSLLRDYLHWPGSRVHFVDWAKDISTRVQVLAALDGLKRTWPAADVVKGDINTVIKTLPLVGFANLDFMGFNRESVMPCVQHVLTKLAPGGVLGLTWWRSREIDKPNRSAWDVFEAARDVPALKDRRWAGVIRLVERWGREANVRLELAGALEYQHAHAPMSVVAWRRPWQ